MGYQTPTNMIGDVPVSSVCVYYPDYPEFKSALLGALLFFTKWTAWERDDNHSASLAAKLWSIAHDETVKTWDISCGDCADNMCNCDDIREIVNEELEKMAITNCITVNCGCGSGGTGGTGGTDNIPPVGYEPAADITQDEPVQPLPTETYIAFKCNRSYELHYNLRTAALKLGDMWEMGQANYENVKDQLNLVFGGAATPLVELWEWYYGLTTRLGQAFTQVTTSEIVGELDRSQADFVCALMGADGVNDARSRFKGVLNSLNLPFSALYYLQMLEQSIDYGFWLYPDDWQTVTVDPSFVGRDCSHCDALQSVAEPPTVTESGYILYPVPSTACTANLENNTTWVQGSNAEITTANDPTSHYGGGTLYIDNDLLLATLDQSKSYELKGVVVELLTTSHPDEPYRQDVYEQDTNGETVFKSWDTLKTEVEALDSGNFITQFDNLVYGGGSFTGLAYSFQWDFLDSTNQPYAGSMTFRSFVLLKVTTP